MIHVCQRIAGGRSSDYSIIGIQCDYAVREKRRGERCVTLRGGLVFVVKLAGVRVQCPAGRKRLFVNDDPGTGNRIDNQHSPAEVVDVRITSKSGEYFHDVSISQSGSKTIRSTRYISERGEEENRLFSERAFRFAIHPVITPGIFVASGFSTKKTGWFAGFQRVLSLEIILFFHTGAGFTQPNFQAGNMQIKIHVDMFLFERCTSVP